MSRRLNSIDLNLFFVLDALYRHRSVSRAALELGISQSAISHSLAKIRRHFSDPMFVRIAGGIEPTKVARTMEPEILFMIEKGRQLTAQAKQFSVKDIEDTIVIYATDLFETLLGPKVFARMKSEAPGIRLVFRSASGNFPKEVLERGDSDIAIGGFLKSLPTGFYRQSLFEDEYVVCFRQGHPTLQKAVTEKVYFEQAHARMSITGDLSDQLKKSVRGERVTRDLQYGSAHFANLFLLVSQTDLILTAPRRIAEFYQPMLKTEIRECPIKIPHLRMEMSWHGLTHSDPVKKWARKIIREISLEL